MSTKLKATPNRVQFVKAAEKEFPGVNPISRKKVIQVHEKYRVNWPSWLTSNKELRAGRGMFEIPEFINEDDIGEVEVKQRPGKAMLGTTRASRRGLTKKKTS